MKNAYKINGEYTIIYVKRKGKIYEVLIDTEDLELVSDFKGTWHLDNRGYIKRTISQRVELMHRLIMNPPNNMVVDHIDGNKLNNRKHNLRIVKPSQNTQNIHHPHKVAESGIKGVKREKRWGTERWLARIGVHGREISLGYYDNIEDARIASIVGRILYHPYSKEARIYNKLLQEKRDIK